MNVWQKIENNYPSFGLRPMANSIDLIGELILIDRLNPKSCWELGTGKADWALFMNLYMKTPAHWHLTETFDWATTANDAKRKYIPDDWPKNKQEIEKHISNFSKKTNKNMSYTLYNQDISKLLDSIEDPVDLWRIDCDLDNADVLLKKMLDKSSQNVIFFVDDIESNRCINRLCTMMDQVRLNNLDLIYMGKGEAAWVRPSTLKLSDIYELFKIQLEYFNKITPIDDKIIYNKRREYILIE